MKLVAIALAALVAAACTEEPKPRRQDPSVPNPPSRGFIDAPAANQGVGPAAVVAGWAIDESGVDRVRIWADDRLLASVPLTLARPDVEAAFPAAAKPGAVHGWQASVDFGDKAGYTAIRAEVLDGRGALTHVASVTVQIQR
jgi:hypothetical protein